MLNSVKSNDGVTSTSHKPIGKDSEVSKDNPPKAALRASPPKNDGDGKSRSEDSLNPSGDFKDDDEQGRPNVEVPTNGGTGHIYAKINRKTKSPEESLDSGMPPIPPLYSDVPSTPKRRDSVDSDGSEYSTPLKRSEKTTRDLTEKFDAALLSYGYTPSTTTDDSNRPLIPDNGSRGSVSIIGENGFWPRVKHAVKKKEFVIPTVSATMITIFLAAYSAYAYLQDHAKFIAFIESNPKFITVPSAIALSLFIIGIACAVSQFKNTREFQIQAKNADANMILDKVFECQPGDKIIKSVILKYTNRTHSYVTFNFWESRNNFIDIDEKVINRTSKIGAVINDRPLPVMLLTGVVVANLIIPSALYAIGGINAMQHFYQNILANNIGLFVVTGSAILAVSALCLAVHDYRKSGCFNFACFHEGKIDNNQANIESRDKIKQDRTDILGENHGKGEKRSSLTLEKVIVQAHNFPETAYTVHSVC